MFMDDEELVIAGSVGHREELVPSRTGVCLYAYAAVCPFDGSLDVPVLPEVNTESMSSVPSRTIRQSYQ